MAVDYNTLSSMLDWLQEDGPQPLAVIPREVAEAQNRALQVIEETLSSRACAVSDEGEVREDLKTMMRFCDDRPIENYRSWERTLCTAIKMILEGDES